MVGEDAGGVGVGFLEVLGDAERVGDVGVCGGVVDRGAGVPDASALSVGGRYAELFEERLDVGVFDPFGFVWDSLVVENKSREIALAIVNYTRTTIPTSSSKGCTTKTDLASTKEYRKK